jgi:hypothetical protein
MGQLLLLIANVALGAGLLSGPLGLPSSTIDEKKVQAVLSADEARTAAERYGELFNSLTTEGLKKLQTHSSDTIAIQAAWEEIERGLPMKSDSEIRLDRDKLARFLGFLEGRGRARAPRWWAEAILDARAYGRGNVYAGGYEIDIIDLFGNRDRDASRPKAIWPPPEASIGKHQGKTIVRTGLVNQDYWNLLAAKYRGNAVSQSGLATAPIPSDLPKKLGVGSRKDGLSALITSSRCYVAAYEDWGYPYRLACVDLPSGQLRWITGAWGSWWYCASGINKQFVEVIEQQDRVVVFGITAGGFHVEAFRKDDGVNLFRFSNSYSGH